MEALKVTEFTRSTSTHTQKIDGFTDAELDYLNLIDYRDMKQYVLDELDKRNNKLGSTWHNGYGVYNVWIRGKSVYVEIGNTCD